MPLLLSSGHSSSTAVRRYDHKKSMVEGHGSTTRTVYAFSKYTDSSIRKLANYTIYGKKTQQIIFLSYGHTSSSSVEGYVLECICDYAEAKLFSITRGINKEQKHIIQNIEQQKMRTMNMAQLQEKDTNCHILGSPSSYS